MEGDNKLITEQIALEPGQKSLKVVREFKDDGIYLEMMCEDIIHNKYISVKPKTFL